MEDLTTRLNCSRCNAFTEWEKDESEGESIYCEECGKKHSTDSFRPVQPGKEYSRDEAGNLTEMPP